MKRRIFSLYLAIGALLLLVVIFTTRAQSGAQAQFSTTTPTSIPGADFSGTPRAGAVPLTVQFTALNNSILSSCLWTFGDGATQTFTPPTGQTFSICPATSHVYTTTGFFTVSLRVTKATSGTSNTVTKPNYIQVTNPGEFTATPTKTLIPCGAVIVVTSTFTPTVTATPTRTATATSTSCGPIYITATPDGPTATRTYTATPGPTSTGTGRSQTPFITPTFTPVITKTITRTNTPTFTPTLVTGACSPVTSTITAPFTFDGAGVFCWQSNNLGTYINSWNTTSVTINGVNISNVYVAAGSYPAQIGGFWYVGYNSGVAWGHFEAK